MSVLVSDCCETSPDELCNEDTGFCPTCRDHTSFIDISEIEELDYPEPRDRDPVNRLLREEKEYDPSWNAFVSTVTTSDLGGMVLCVIAFLLFVGFAKLAE